MGRASVQSYSERCAPAPSTPCLARVQAVCPEPWAVSLKPPEHATSIQACQPTRPPDAIELRRRKGDRCVRAHAHHATARQAGSARSGCKHALGVLNDGLPSLSPIGLACERSGTRGIGLWEEPPRPRPVMGAGLRVWAEHTCRAKQSKAHHCLRRHALAGCCRRTKRPRSRRRSHLASKTHTHT